MLLVGAFAANAYASAYASSCDCTDMAPIETIKVEMQCHDAEGLDSASDTETFHQDNASGCNTCAYGYCEVPSQTPLFNGPGTNLVSDDGRHGLSAKVPKSPLSYGIDYPPKHTS